MSSEKTPEKLTITVEIPVLDRGEDAFGKPITDEKFAQTVSYVLNLYLKSYCKHMGAPKLGPVSANGQVIEA